MVTRCNGNELELLNRPIALKIVLHPASLFPAAKVAIGAYKADGVEQETGAVLGF